LPALEQPVAEIVVTSGLPRVKALHPRGVILAAHRLEREVVEDLEIRS
jgi:hypothetical protein